MVLKSFFTALVGAALMLAGGAAAAADYRPDELLNLDLSKAVLSPTPLGPPAEFAPVPVEAKSEPSGLLAGNDAKKVAVQRIKLAHVRPAVARPTVHVAQTKPHRAARVRLAHRHGNPMNAQAFDTRIQKWPCSPDYGGICNWR
jgi:hypothetical protein